MPTSTTDTGAAVRDHVFISYANEDVVLADWLARRLADEGYAVWYDRMKLLGGEPWPHVIDAAIKTRSHRVVQLISMHSLARPHPSGERTLAQGLATKLGIPDFFIPLNIAGLAATDLPFTLTAVQYIAFNRSWAAGLAALIRTLDAAGTPRVLKNGRTLVLQTMDTDAYIVREPEIVLSNVFPIPAMPEAVIRFKSDTCLPRPGMCRFRDRWVARIVNHDTCLAFWPPPADVAAEFGLKPAGGSPGRSSPQGSSLPLGHLPKETSHGEGYSFRDRDGPRGPQDPRVRARAHDGRDHRAQVVSKVVVSHTVFIDRGYTFHDPALASPQIEPE